MQEAENHYRRVVIHPIIDIIFGVPFICVLPASIFGGGGGLIYSWL